MGERAGAVQTSENTLLGTSRIRAKEGPERGALALRFTKVLQLARYLQDGDFAHLHTRHRCRAASGLRYSNTYPSRRFLGGPKDFFALPEGYTLQLAGLSIA